jgi:hypothetical protein
MDYHRQALGNMKFPTKLQLLSCGHKGLCNYQEEFNGKVKD